MTEIEKQAISKIREIIEYDKKHRLETIYDKKQIEFRNNIELVLDLIEKLKKENEELNKQYDQLTQYFVKNHVAKDKIREIIEELENEEKALRKDFEKHRVQLFELYKKVVLIEGYKKLLEEE